MAGDFRECLRLNAHPPKRLTGTRRFAPTAWHFLKIAKREISKNASHQPHARRLVVLSRRDRARPLTGTGHQSPVQHVPVGRASGAPAERDARGRVYQLVSRRRRKLCRGERVILVAGVSRVAAAARRRLAGRLAAAPLSPRRATAPPATRWARDAFRSGRISRSFPGMPSPKASRGMSDKRAFVPLRRRRRRLRRTLSRRIASPERVASSPYGHASPKSRARTTPSPSPPSPAAPSSRSLRRRARRPFSHVARFSHVRVPRACRRASPLPPAGSRVPAGRAAPPAESRTARPPRAANPPAARRGACSRAPCSARQRTPRTRPRARCAEHQAGRPRGDEPERAVRARAGDVPGGHRAHLHVRLALLQQSELVRRERGVARARAVHQPREYLRRVRAERRGPEPVREDPTRRAPRARGGSNPSTPAPGEAPATLIARPRVRERARRHPSRITMRSERVFVRVYVQ